MGLSSKASWELTPREFAALENVYYSTLQRWEFERAHNANLAGAKHPSGRGFRPSDFAITPDSLATRERGDRERIELAAMKRQEAQQIAAMRAGSFPEDQLPAWARMTPQEKQERSA